MKPVLFTQSGLDDIREEYDALKLKRVSAVSELKTARELGDLSENAAYKVARTKLSGIDRRLVQIALVLRRAIVADIKRDGTVGIGSHVLLDLKGEKIRYEVVGGYESDPPNGKVSHFSPLGKALLGKKAGDVVTIHVPAGAIEYSVIEVK